jgi:hypothetical protein
MNTNTSLMREVLKPRVPSGLEDIKVPPLAIEPGTPAAEVVYRASMAIRGLVIENRKPVDREDYLAECFETEHEVPHAVAQEVAANGDLITAAAVQFVFRQAMDGLRILPTTKQGQREMRECALAAGQAIRGLLFRQQALAL